MRDAMLTGTDMAMVTGTDMAMVMGMDMAMGISITIVTESMVHIFMVRFTAIRKVKTTTMPTMTKHKPFTI